MPSGLRNISNIVQNRVGSRLSRQFSLPTQRRLKGFGSSVLDRLKESAKRQREAAQGIPAAPATPVTPSAGGGGTSGGGASGGLTPARQRSDVKSQLESLAKQIAEQVRVPTRTLTLEDVFTPEEQRLARIGISQRVARVLDPRLERGLENIGTQFAQRGLLRSGMRGEQQNLFGEDIAEQRAIQERDLFNIRLREANERLSEQQRRLEQEAAQAAAAQRANNIRDILRRL